MGAKGCGKQKKGEVQGNSGGVSGQEPDAGDQPTRHDRGHDKNNPAPAQPLIADGNVSPAGQRLLLDHIKAWAAAEWITAEQAERLSAHYGEPLTPCPTNGAETARSLTPAMTPHELEQGQNASDCCGRISHSAAGAQETRPATTTWHPQRRTGVNALLHTVGTAMVGVAIIWLVGANLKYFTEGGKVGLFVGLMVTFVAGASAAHRYFRQAGAWVFMLQTLAVVTMGATILQTALWLGIDEPHPWLVGLWAGGSLGYALLTRSTAAAVISAVLGIVFVPWQVVDGVDAPFGDGTARMLSTVTACASASVYMAASHWVGPELRVLAASWRVMATVATLGTSLVFAVSIGLEGGNGLVVVDNVAVVAALSVVSAAAVAATWWRMRSQNRAQMWQNISAAASPMVGAWLFLVVNAVAAATGTSTASFATEPVHASTLAMGVALLVLGIVLCLWHAVLGTVQHDDGSVVVAVGALVLFVGIQTTTLFLPFFSGAWVALLVGVVLIALAWGLNEGRPVLGRLVARYAN